MILAEIGSQDGFGPDDVMLWLTLLGTVLGAIGWLGRQIYRVASILEKLQVDVEAATAIAKRLDDDVNLDHEDQGSIRGRLRHVEESIILLTQMLKEQSDDRKRYDQRLAVVEDRLNIHSTRGGLS